MFSFTTHEAKASIASEKEDSTHLVNSATELDENYDYRTMILYKDSNLDFSEPKGKAPIQNAIMINNDKRVIRLIKHGVDMKGMA